MEPRNVQARELKKLIQQKMKRGARAEQRNGHHSLSLSHPVDGMITAGIMGGAALLGAAAIALVGMGIAKALK